MELGKSLDEIAQDFERDENVRVSKAGRERYKRAQKVGNKTKEKKKLVDKLFDRRDNSGTIQ